VKLVVCEGIFGTFHYHVCNEEHPWTAFCGAKTMPTKVPVETWGMKTHLCERYCEKCGQHITGEKVKQERERQ